MLLHKYEAKLSVSVNNFDIMQLNVACTMIKGTRINTFRDLLIILQNKIDIL